MGNHLHSAAKVIAAAFAAQNGFIHLAAGEVVGLGHFRAQEALVVAEVEIRFGAVLGDKHLAVLKGTHGARVHIEIGIEFQGGDFEAARFEHGTERRGGNALPEGGNNTTGNKNKTCH